jgi:hypothetical protein
MQKALKPNILTVQRDKVKRNNDLYSLNTSFSYSTVKFQNILRDFKGYVSVLGLGCSNIGIGLGERIAVNHVCLFICLAYTYDDITRNLLYVTTLSVVYVKNEWSYTSSPPVCVHGVDRDN